MVTLKCVYCDSEFKVRPYRKDSAKFCSKHCYEEEKASRGNFECNCDNCNKVFTTTKSQYDKYDNHFCSKKCRNEFDSIRYLGEANPSYNQVEHTCDMCNAKFKKPESSFSRPRKFYFCNKTCKDKWMKDIYPKTEEGIAHYRRNGVNSTKNANKKETMPELLVKYFLEDIEVKFIQQYKLFDKYLCDFYLPDFNLIIEVQGDYWHSNPSIYKNEDLNERQIKQKEKDARKERELKESGYIVYMVWESCIYDDVDEALSFVNEIICKESVTTTRQSPHANVDEDIV